MQDAKNAAKNKSGNGFYKPLPLLIFTYCNTSKVKYY